MLLSPQTHQALARQFWEIWVSDDKVINFVEKWQHENGIRFLPDNGLNEFDGDIQTEGRSIFSAI